MSKEKVSSFDVGSDFHLLNLASFKLSATNTPHLLHSFGPPNDLSVPRPNAFVHSGKPTIFAYLAGNK